MRRLKRMLRAATGLAFLGVLSLGFAKGQAPPAPTPAAEKPAAEKEKPAAEKEKPAAEKEKPAAEKEKPAAEKEKPAAEKEKPAAEKEKPAAEKEKPAAEKEKPAAEKGEPAPEKKEAPPLCVDCHEDQGKSFRGNAHTRVPGVSWGKSVSDNKACESCHGAGTKHMDSAGEDKSDIRVFQGRPGADFCLTCHTNLSASLSAHTSFRTGPPEGINCLSCHSVHSSAPRTPRLLQKTPTALCASCHPARAAAFHDKPFAHRIGRGGMECTSCHDPHGLPENHGLRLTRTGEMPCLTCHAEKRGPFVFEHAPLFIGNCLSCHEPHGSSNQKMLIRARVDQLCLECHSTLNLSTLGSQPPATHNVTLPRWRNCTTCHTAIHGSNLSPRLFK